MVLNVYIDCRVFARILGMGGQHFWVGGGGIQHGGKTFLKGGWGRARPFFRWDGWGHLI